MLSNRFANQPPARSSLLGDLVDDKVWLKVTLRFFYPVWLFTKTLIKAVLLFSSILPVVAIVAAIVGCLTLSNGNILYLFNPTELFDFVFNVRAGLKVTVLFVTFLLFFFCVNDGMLSRNWLRKSAPTPFRI